jgi:choline dehydrogenase-like flavoprotein
MRVAIVGSGAAAAGALGTLVKLRPDASVVLFEAGGRPNAEPARPAKPSEQWVREFYDDVYALLSERYGRQLLPSKSLLGEMCPTQLVDGDERFFHAELFGGQTNFWGGCALPFQAPELRNWPITTAELDPYYREIAELVGISGEHDALNNYFNPDYANRPPMRLLRGMARLRDTVTAHPAGGAYEVHAGVSRMTLETRAGHPSACVYCGECCAGCFTGAVYSSRATLDPLVRQHGVEVVEGKVVRLEPQRGAVAVGRASGLEWHERFDRVFLCAGCVGTTEIVMRSTGVKEGPVMVDSAIAQFPIFNLGICPGSADRDKSQYLGLAQLIMACVPRDPRDEYVQVQVYPNMDYLWRTAVPRWAWPAFRPLVARARDRFLIARLCTHSKDGFAYTLRLNGGDGLEFGDCRQPNRDAVRPVLDSLRSTINHAGFRMYPGPPIWAGTSAHLAGTLPYGSGLFDVQRDGAVLPGVHICDSSCFPEAVAVSPTLTVMANASRTVTEALN